MKTRSDRTWKTLLILVELAVSVLLLNVILSFVDLHLAVRHFSAFPVGVVIFLVLGITALGAIQAIRWKEILLHLHRVEPLRPLMRLVFLSIGVMQVAPGPIAADAVRSVGLVRLGVPPKVAVFSCLLDRVAALLALVLLAVAALPFFWLETARPASSLLLAYVCFLGAMLGVAVLLQRARNPFHPGGGKPNVIIRILSRLWGFFSSGQVLTRAILMSLAIHASLVISVYLLFQQINSAVSLIHCFALLPFVLLASMLPISFAGWGVREGTMVGFFSLVGVSSDISLAVSLAFGAINMLAGLLSFILSRTVLR